MRSTLVVLFLLAASCTPNTCPRDEVDRFIGQVHAANYELDDIMKRASATARFALPPVVAELQSLRSEFAALPSPPCASETKAAEIRVIDKYVDSLLKFAKYGSEAGLTTDQDDIKEAREFLGQKVIELRAAGH